MALTGDFSEFRFVDILPFLENNTLAFKSEWFPGEGDLVMYINRGELLHAHISGRVCTESEAREGIRLFFTRANGRFAAKPVPYGAIPKTMRINIGAVVLKTSAEFDEFTAGKRQAPKREVPQPEPEEEPEVPARGFWGSLRDLFSRSRPSRVG